MISNINKRIAELYILGNKYADAKSREVELTHFRKSKLAILKIQYSADNPKWSNSKCDDYARADEAYTEVLRGLGVAVLEKERAHQELITARAGIQIYQTQRADRRAELNNLKDIT